MWGSPAKGRSWLREQRAFHKVAVPEGSLRDPRYPPAPPTPEGIEELSGFAMTTELANAISAIDLGKAQAWDPARPRPATLVITRHQTGDDKTLVAAMSARGITPTLEARDGFGNMFAEPHLSTAPLPIVELMRDWLVKDAPARAPYPRQETQAAARRSRGADRQGRHGRGDRALSEGRRRPAVLDRDPAGRPAPRRDVARVPHRPRGPSRRSESDLGAVCARAGEAGLRNAPPRRPQRRRQRRRRQRPDAERGVLPGAHLRRHRGRDAARDGAGCASVLHVGHLLRRDCLLSGRVAAQRCARDRAAQPAAAEERSGRRLRSRFCPGQPVRVPRKTSCSTRPRTSGCGKKACRRRSASSRFPAPCGSHRSTRRARSRSG